MRDQAITPLTEHPLGDVLAAIAVGTPNATGAAIFSGLNRGNSPRKAMMRTARALIGSPYAFNSEHGYDAFSFVKACVNAATERFDHLEVPRTSPGWDGVSGSTMRTALVGWGLHEIRFEDARPGDVLVFSALGGGVHVAIKGERAHADEFSIVHAYWGRSVVESWASPSGWADKPLIGAWTLDRPQPPAANAPVPQGEAA